MKKFWRNNSLSIVLLSIFAAALIGMSIVGQRTSNNEAATYGEPQESYLEYITSGDFIEGVFENWESEFLQMWALVVLTVYLRQKGADDSKPINKKTPQDTHSRYSIINARDWKTRGKAIRHGIYAHSLSLALLSIFLMSLMLHAIGGTSMYNKEAERHGEPTVSVIGYMTTSQFWYESLQNWQSEFLAVGSLILLSIYLRERGTPESKPVGRSYDNSTGD